MEIPPNSQSPADSQDSQHPPTCIFCFDELDVSATYRRLPCRHLFHKQCIDDWMAKRDASCPLCRRTFYHLKKVEEEEVARSVTSVQAGTTRARRRRRSQDSTNEAAGSGDGFDALKRWVVRRVMDRG